MSRARAAAPAESSGERPHRHAVVLMSRRWRGGHASAVAAPRRDNLICAPVSAILSSPSRSPTTRPRNHLASPAQYTSTQRCNAPSRGFSAGGARARHAGGSLSGSVSPFFQVTRQAPAWKSNVGHPTLSTRHRLGSRVRFPPGSAPPSCSPSVHLYQPSSPSRWPNRTYAVAPGCCQAWSSVFGWTGTCSAETAGSRASAAGGARGGATRRSIGCL